MLFNSFFGEKAFRIISKVKYTSHRKLQLLGRQVSSLSVVRALTSFAADLHRSLRSLVALRGACMLVAFVA
jgi:hypothetical protein